MKLSLSLLLSLTLTTQQVAATNIDELDTPLVDALADFLCDEESESALCSVLGVFGGNGTNTEDVDLESGPTLGAFLLTTACDIGLVPPVLCQEDDEEDNVMVQSNATLISFTEEETLVDGFIMGLACGENGNLPDVLCTAMVGRDANSGLISRFCASGRIIPSGICERMGAETPAPEGDNGGRNLRHR